MRKGESVTFNYTGSVQPYTFERSGYYKLEVWGGKGGNATYTSSVGTGGYGGYSVGYKKFKKGSTIYIACGGKGEDGVYSGGNTAGGWNGGGTGGYHDRYGDYDRSSGGAGGGATHIALRTGTLAQIGASNLSQILIVAGGGGGARCDYAQNGGAGGGTSGGSVGSRAGGTQTSGYAFGQGGAGANPDRHQNVYNGRGGGGGGLYGGYGGIWDDSSSAGAGGSGYIGGVENYKEFTKSTISGVNNSTGKATITLVSSSAIKYGTKDCAIFYGNKEISLHYGNKDM